MVDEQRHSLGHTLQALELTLQWNLNFGTNVQCLNLACHFRHMKMTSSCRIDLRTKIIQAKQWTPKRFFLHILQISFSLVEGHQRNSYLKRVKMAIMVTKCGACHHVFQVSVFLSFEKNLKSLVKWSTLFSQDFFTLESARNKIM